MKYLAIQAGGYPQKAQVKLGAVWSHSFVPLFDTHEECSIWWDRYGKMENNSPAWAITTVGNLLKAKPSVFDELTNPKT